MKITDIVDQLGVIKAKAAALAEEEKKLKKAYPNVWDSLQGFVTQAPGKPSVAPASDPRPQFGGAVFDGDSYAAGDLV
jgi:hypothetical protein